jgi:hypothetical protein
MSPLEMFGNAQMKAIDPTTTATKPATIGDWGVSEIRTASTKAIAHSCRVHEPDVNDPKCRIRAATVANRHSADRRSGARLQRRPVSLFGYLVLVLGRCHCES